MFIELGGHQDGFFRRVHRVAVHGLGCTRPENLQAEVLGVAALLGRGLDHLNWRVPSASRKARRKTARIPYSSPSVCASAYMCVTKKTVA